MLGAASFRFPSSSCVLDAKKTEERGVTYSNHGQIVRTTRLLSGTVHIQTHSCFLQSFVAVRKIAVRVNKH